MEQAKERLQQLKPGIWIATYYATEEDRYWPTGRPPQIDAGKESYHPFHNAKIHIPVSLVAGYIDKAYQDGPDGIKPVKDGNTPIYDLSGEFFRLFFTPGDGGGRLYAIVRQRIYFSDRDKPLNFYLAANVPLPQKADLEKGAIEKYGAPSKIDETGRPSIVNLYWFYDRTGEKLTGHTDGCESRFLDVNRGAGYTHPPLESIKAGGVLTLRELVAAFEDRDFYKLGYRDSKTDLEEDIRRIANLVPAMVLSHGRSPQEIPDTEKTGYQNCGTQVHIELTPTSYGEVDPGYAFAMTVSVSDQSAVFFNNGVADYMKQQMQKVLPKMAPTPPKEKY
jgi:hypothetical protein